MMIKNVEQIKAEANASFKANKFKEADNLYTAAINLANKSSSPSDDNNNKTLAVLYGNRANANIKLENYGSAISDSTEALKYNPSYIKAYFRRATAYFAMCNYKQAKKDYTILKRMFKSETTDSKDISLKLKECEKRIREIAFAKAIESDSLHVKISTTISPNSFHIEDTYKGPRIPESGQINLDFINQMLDTFRKQQKLHVRYVVQILLEAKKIMDDLPNVVELPIGKNDQITVCGDVHGQYYDLANSIFKQNGLPSAENPYLFNGDFVDRGSFSVEVILTLLAIKVYDPRAIHLTRGNHESQNMNRIYGFEGECTAKYSDTIFKLFTELFQSLPLAFILDGTTTCSSPTTSTPTSTQEEEKEEEQGRKAFIVHGGLFSKDGVTIADINKLDRRTEPDSGIMAEMLWSDPQEAQGWGTSKRGIGVAFGPDVTKRFLDHNKLDLIVRSHEMKEEGYEITANGKLITIFSAPNYCDTMGNKGAYIKFDYRMQPDIKQFTAVPHPNVQPMQYASNLLFGGGGM